MSKRARWNGSEPVRVTYPPGEVSPESVWVVVPNGLLPAEAPAALRDELLARPDWSEFKQAEQPKDKE